MFPRGRPRGRPNARIGRGTGQLGGAIEVGRAGREGFSGMAGRVVRGQLLRGQKAGSIGPVLQE